MSLPNLDRLVGVGLLHAEPPALEEFDGLLKSGLARLHDGGNATLALESQFDLTYNAAHALCLAALRWHGYRPANKRYIVFQVLPDTLGLGPEVWRVLAKAHDLRNRSEYEGAQEIDQRMRLDLLTACTLVAQKVQALSATVRADDGVEARVVTDALQAKLHAARKKGTKKSE